MRGCTICTVTLPNERPAAPSSFARPFSYHHDRPRAVSLRTTERSTLPFAAN
jgi:hypothetical protein